LKFTLTRFKGSAPGSLYPALIGLAALVFCVVACSRGGSKAAKSERRGELTVEYYAPQPGIGHGDGVPGGCFFTFKGQRYGTPPMVKNGGRMFRCDVKPDSDDPVIRIAFYRPEDDWTCGTRFGALKAKCLPDHYEAAGGILTVRNGELAFEDHGFWDVSYDWGEHSVKFKDGREFDYHNWTWSGCGDAPLHFVKTGSLTVASGQFCNSEDWHRVYFAGKEVVAAGAFNHPFDSVGINQNAEVPSATVWIGHIKGFIYISKGKPVSKEVANSPEIIEDGKSTQWWSEDYQTRYRMNLASETTTSQTRTEVQANLETRIAEKNIARQEAPVLDSDEFGKFEIDYKDRHTQFYLGDLEKYDELKDTGEYPHKATTLLTAAQGTTRFYVFLLRNVTETKKVDDPCIGSITLSVIWVQANEDLFPRNAKSQVISSCKLGRHQVGEPNIIDGKLTIVFEEMRKRYKLTYNNNEPELGLAVSGLN
jgi:hypothetical protein